MDDLDFLDLEGWKTVSKRTVGENDIEVTAEPRDKRTVCPHCGMVGRLVKLGYTAPEIHDVPRGGQRLAIVVNHQRYKCKECGRLCHDELPSIDQKRAMTLRLLEYTQDRTMNDRFTHVAAAIGLHEKTVRNVFKDWRDWQEEHNQIAVPRILGLDEIHLLGKARAVLTNVERSTFVDFLPDRLELGLQARFFKWSKEERAGIEFVTTDMHGPYRQVVHKMLPNATQVVDKFHVLRMANEALDIVRRELGQELGRQHKRKLMRERFLLLRRSHSLDGKQYLKLQAWLFGLPALKAAYEAKEGFFGIFDEPDDPANPGKRILKTRAEAEELYGEWLLSLSPELLQSYSKLTTAMKNWHDEIFDFFDTHLTNALTESMNSVARSIDRMSRGLSFEVLRAKLLYKLPHRAVAKRPAYGKTYQFGPYTPPTPDQVDVGVSVYTLLHPDEEPPSWLRYTG